MNQKQINELAVANQVKARTVLESSGIADIWAKAGCRVNLVGSLRMGLLMTHRDIDLHVYSRGITEQFSFSVVAEIATNPNVTEIRCINGLSGDEHCIAWHIMYRHDDEIWQFDVIHIESGTTYDGYFENMADRILQVLTPIQKDTILRLKYETSGEDFHGVEYYEAVIADGIDNVEDFRQWVTQHRNKPPYYWIP